MAEIAPKRDRHVQHSVSAPLSRVERFINSLKNGGRLATCYDRTANSLLGFATLASTGLVHATYGRWRAGEADRRRS